MNAGDGRRWNGVAILAIGLCILTAPASSPAVGLGSGAAGFSGGGGFGGRGGGVGVPARVSSPVIGAPLAPVGYDASNVAPAPGAAPALRPGLSTTPGSGQPRLYNSVRPGQGSADQDDSSTSVGGGGGGQPGILPPDGSGFLVVEDGAGGATIYGPTGVRRVENFDRSRLQELTKP